MSVAAVAMALFSASPASAHPLGNFSINHLDALHFGTDRITDDAIIDTAEIPTAQAADSVDINGDGTASAAEFVTYAVAQCDLYRQTLTLTIDGAPVAFTATAAAASYQPGQAGLDTTRLECGFEAKADLSVARSVAFSNSFAPNRVGWHEIIADGDGSHLVDSPVPSTSVTNGLRKYPVDLLASPLDNRSASFRTAPGRAASTAVAPSASSKSTFAKAIGPFSGVVDRVNGVFNDLVGRRDLTLSIGLLAIGLALILGASHALLPGHGKTVMAAYIAGRQGSVRDAVLVGATVTATHTGGVLLLGLALTLSTSLAGESVLGWLGAVSGVMIAGLGGSLLFGAIRRRGKPDSGHEHRHGFGGHTHSHGFGAHTHDHDDEPADAVIVDVAEIRPARELVDAMAAIGVTPPALALRGSSTAVLQVLQEQAPVRTQSTHSHADGHRHSHDEHSHDEHSHDGHSHDEHSHDAKPTRGRASWDAAMADEPKKFSRRGLVGMGIAGGLVPSPSALVVLLSAIALGRTVFGVVLVIGYGVGMAGTLTAAGILLVRVRDRYQRRADDGQSRIRKAAARWTRLAPYATASLVLVVGLGLAVRSLGSI